MVITVQELRLNLEKYLDLAKTEPVVIVLDDHSTLILSDHSSKQDRLKEMKSLFGSVPNRYGEEVLEERLMKL